MAHVISDECVMCGSCEGECPVGAISEGDGKYEISMSDRRYFSRVIIYRKVITGRTPFPVGTVFFCHNFANDS